MKFELDMLISSLESVVDNYTRLGLAGDTCQVKTMLQTLRCRSSLHASCSLGISAVVWILDRLIAEKPTPLQFVKQVDLLNRDKPSQRCRQSSCEVVNKMAPHCLPGGSAWWEKAVAGKKVWADLLPVTNTTNLEAFMTSHTPEVVSVWPRTTPCEPQTPASMSMIGYVGKSRYDVDVAL